MARESKKGFIYIYTSVVFFKKKINVFPSFLLCGFFTSRGDAHSEAYIRNMHAFPLAPYFHDKADVCRLFHHPSVGSKSRLLVFRDPPSYRVFP